MRHTVGDERVVWRFLLFPVSIYPETRWLCFSKIRQKYVWKTYTIYSPSPGWQNIEWED